MEKFKEELATLLKKYNALIFVEQEENDSFLMLQIRIGNNKEDIDTGYRDLMITSKNLK